jgi:2-polyprenyl-6-hydroxyphenyl methylase / 3-demethylubiquinone-9 3-methyltransferase
VALPISEELVGPVLKSCHSKNGATHDWDYEHPGNAVGGESVTEKSFYQAETTEEALEIYFRLDDELYGRTKNATIMGVLSRLYDDAAWSSLRILEVGPGGGIWTDFFLRKGATVTCVDICKPVLDGNALLHPSAKFILCDATVVDIGERFDFIFAKDVIEHIENDQQFLRNMRNHLNDEGLILLNTQNSLCLNYLLQGGYHYLKGTKGWCGWDPTHVRFYNMISLRKKLVENNFRIKGWFGSYYVPYRPLGENVGRFCCFIERGGLYKILPFSVIGWNIGVVAQKVH